MKLSGISQLKILYLALKNMVIPKMVKGGTEKDGLTVKYSSNGEGDSSSKGSIFLDGKFSEFLNP